MTGSGAGKGFEYNIRKNFLITAIIPLAVLLALFILFIGFFNEISIRGRTERAAENVRQKIQQMDHFYRSVCENQAQDEGLKGCGQEREATAYLRTTTGLSTSRKVSSRSAFLILNRM